MQDEHSRYLSFDRGGLASMALKCINQELTTFHEWQTLINVESKS